MNSKSAPMTGQHLSSFDDYLVHQSSRPVRYATTTDHRFYDRYWFESISPSGDTQIILGMGQYRNTGMCDGYISAQRENTQTNVRMARPLGMDLGSAVGPLSVSILEPFKLIRLSVSPGEHPIAAELEWQATAAAHLEMPTVRHDGGRIVQDSSRYGQLGRLSGHIEIDGKQIVVADWWAVRDHSWGVRPGVGGFEIRPSKQESSYLHLWTFASTDHLLVQAQQIETGEGEAWYTDGSIVDLQSGTVEKVTGLTHEISFISGTREWSALRYIITTDTGREICLDARACQRAWAYRGTGYSGGYTDRLGLGAVRDATLEWDTLDLSRHGHVMCERVPYAPGHREQAAEVVIDGSPGYGHLATVSSGTIRRYGLHPRRR